jgi:hypothetical protein
MTMKRFTGKTQKNWWNLHIPITGKKKKIGGVYIRPFITFLS